MNQSLGDLGWCIIIFHSHLHTTLRKDADMSNVIQASSARARIQIVSQTYFWSLQAQEAVSLKDCYSKWSELHQSLSKRFLHAFCQRQIRSQAALMGSVIPTALWCWFLPRMAWKGKEWEWVSQHSVNSIWEQFLCCILNYVLFWCFQVQAHWIVWCASGHD